MAACRCEDIVGNSTSELYSIMQGLGPEEAFGGFYKTQLQQLCELFGLEPGGCKQDLITRVAEHLQKDCGNTARDDLATSVARCARPFSPALRKQSIASSSTRSWSPSQVTLKAKDHGKRPSTTEAVADGRQKKRAVEGKVRKSDASDEVVLKEEVEAEEEEAKDKVEAIEEEAEEEEQVDKEEEEEEDDDKEAKKFERRKEVADEIAALQQLAIEDAEQKAQMVADEAVSTLEDASATIEEVQVVKNQEKETLDKKVITVVMVGPTGQGKSTLGNMLVGGRSGYMPFKTSDDFNSETLESAHADFTHDLKPHRVIDTIGFLDTRMDAAENMDKFATFADRSPAGIDAFLFVMKKGRFTEQSLGQLAAFRSVAGADALQHTIMLFTHCGTETTEALRERCRGSANQHLLSAVDSCAEVLGVDSIAEERRDEDRETLLQAIGEVVKKNKGVKYENATLIEARERRQELVEKINRLSEDRRDAMQDKLHGLFNGRVTFERVQAYVDDALQRDERDRQAEQERLERDRQAEQDATPKQPSFADSLTRIVSQKQRQEEERTCAARTWTALESTLIGEACSLFKERCLQEKEQSQCTATVSLDDLSKEISDFPKRTLSESVSVVTDWGDEVTAEGWFYATHGIATAYTPGAAVSNAELLESMMPKFLGKVEALGFSSCRVAGTWKVTASWEMPGATRKRRQERERLRAAKSWTAVESKLVDEACSLCKERCVRESERSQSTATVCFGALSREIADFPKCVLSDSVSTVNVWGNHATAEAWFHATNGITAAYTGAPVSKVELLESMMPKFLGKLEALGFSSLSRAAGTWNVTASWETPAVAKDITWKQASFADSLRRILAQQLKLKRERFNTAKTWTALESRLIDQACSLFYDRCDQKKEQSQSSATVDFNALSKDISEFPKRAISDSVSVVDHWGDEVTAEAWFYANHGTTTAYTPGAAVSNAELLETMMPKFLGKLEALGLSSCRVAGTWKVTASWEMPGATRKRKQERERLRAARLWTAFESKLIDEACSLFKECCVWGSEQQQTTAEVCFDVLSKEISDFPKRTISESVSVVSDWGDQVTAEAWFYANHGMTAAYTGAPVLNAELLESMMPKFVEKVEALELGFLSFGRVAGTWTVIASWEMPEQEQAKRQVPEESKDYEDTPVLRTLPEELAPQASGTPPSAKVVSPMTPCFARRVPNKPPTKASKASSIMMSPARPGMMSPARPVMTSPASPAAAPVAPGAASLPRTPRASTARKRMGGSPESSEDEKPGQKTSATPEGHSAPASKAKTSESDGILPGNMVTLQGLSAPEFNGQRAETIDWLEAKGRWHCRLIGTGETCNFKPENVVPDAGKFSKGVYVTLQGLSDADMNGKQAELLQWQKTSGCWECFVLDTADIGNYKPRNIALPGDVLASQVGSDGQDAKNSVPESVVSEDLEVASNSSMQEELTAALGLPADDESMEGSAAKRSAEDDGAGPAKRLRAEKEDEEEEVKDVEEDKQEEEEEESKSSAAALVTAGAGDAPKNDSITQGNDSPCSHIFEVEVRLAHSNLLVMRQKLISGDTVKDLKRLVAASRTWPAGALELSIDSLAGKRILQLSETVSAAGLREGSVVTVNCIDLQWHTEVKGSHAQISADGKTVRRRDGLFKFNHAVVITNGPTRAFSFEVLDNSARFRGGLELGFSEVPPDELDDVLPHSLAQLRHAWVCDSNGEFHAYRGSFHCLDTDFEVQRWDPERVHKGDVVALRVTERGSVQLTLNHHAVADWDVRIPPDAVLYPVLGVYGKATAIKLLGGE